MQHKEACEDQVTGILHAAMNSGRARPRLYLLLHGLGRSKFHDSLILFLALAMPASAEITSMLFA